MKTLILAAGRGERMRPLTDSTPKPLLPAGGKPLIVWHLERLAAAGLTEIVINHAHLGEQIESTLGNGNTWGVSIVYSPEPLGALETAGGIARALPRLGDTPFLVVNGDIWCDWDVTRAPALAATLGPEHGAPASLAHLVFVPNPAQHAGGDFTLAGNTVALAAGGPTHTYAGIGLFHPTFFAGVCPDTPLKLRPLLDRAIPCGLVRGELHGGRWTDVGTPERLAELDRQLHTHTVP